MKTKLVIVLSLLLLASMVLGGCQNASNEATTAPTAAPTTNATAEATPEVTADPNLVTFPYEGEPITLTILAGDLGVDIWSKKDDSYLAANNYRAAFGNVEFVTEIQAGDAFTTKVQLYLSTGELPDITICTAMSDILPDYMESGLFLDYAPYMEKYMPNYASHLDSAVMSAIKTPDGEIYGLPTNFPQHDKVEWIWWYNSTLLSELNIAVPTTKAEFIDALYAIKEAKPDLYPLSAISGDGLIAYLFGKDDGAGLKWSEEKGWYYGALDEEETTKEYVQLYQQLWADQIMDPELNTLTEEEKWLKIDDGKWAFCLWYVSMYNRLSADITCEPLPMLPPTDDNGVSTIDIVGNRDNAEIPFFGYFSNVNTEYPEFIAQFLDYTISDKMTTLAAYGIEGLTFEYIDGVPQLLPAVKSAANPNGTIDMSKEPYNAGYYAPFAYWSAGKYNYMFAETSLIPHHYEAFMLYQNALASGEIKAYYTKPMPQLTSEENDWYAQVMTPLSTYVSENIAKFKIGEKSMDEWDDFIAGLQELAGDDLQEVIDMLNSKPQQTMDREFD